MWDYDRAAHFMSKDTFCSFDSVQVDIVWRAHESM